jgi:hypothetical protein
MFQRRNISSILAIYLSFTISSGPALVSSPPMPSCWRSYLDQAKHASLAHPLSQLSLSCLSNFLIRKQEYEVAVVRRRKSREQARNHEFDPCGAWDGLSSQIPFDVWHKRAQDNWRQARDGLLAGDELGRRPSRTTWFCNRRRDTWMAWCVYWRVSCEVDKQGFRFGTSVVLVRRGNCE